jgi:hypothetical protein
MSKRFTYYGSFASVQFFSDLFGMPFMPVSVRKLSPNSVYSGACMRVKRLSDNAEQDINFVSSSPDALLDTAALLTFAGANTCVVCRWYFQDGSGDYLEQTTIANMPRIVNAGTLDTRNSIPAIIFDGSNDFMEVASSSGLTISPTTFYAVSARGADYTGNGLVPCVLSTGVSGLETGYGIFYGSGAFGITTNRIFAQTRYTTAVGTVTGDYANTLNSPNLLQAITTNTQERTWFNGGSQQTSNFTETNNTTTTNITIGARFTGGGYGQYFQGAIQEVGIYQADKTSDQSAMATNITTRYGI